MTQAGRQAHRFAVPLYSLFVATAALPVLRILAGLPPALSPLADGEGVEDMPPMASFLVESFATLPVAGHALPWSLHCLAATLLARVCFIQTRSLPTALACAPLFLFCGFHLQTTVSLSGVPQSLSLICVLAALLLKATGIARSWVPVVIVVLAGALVHPMTWMSLPLLTWELHGKLGRERAVVVAAGTFVLAGLCMWAMPGGELPLAADPWDRATTLLHWWCRLVLGSYVLLVPTYVEFPWEPALGALVLLVLLTGISSTRFAWWSMWVVCLILPLNGISPVGTPQSPLSTGMLAYHAVAGVAVLLAMLLAGLVRARSGIVMTTLAGLLFGATLVSAVSHHQRLANVAVFSANLNQLIHESSPAAARQVRGALNRGGHEVPRQSGYLQLFFHALEQTGEQRPADVLLKARQDLPDAEEFLFIEAVYHSIAGDAEQQQALQAEILSWGTDPGSLIDGLIRSTFSGTGYYFLGLDDMARAEAAFRGALVFAPGDPELTSLLAHAVNTSGRTEEAARLLEALVSSGKADENAIIVAGNLRHAVGHYLQAVHQWERLDSLPLQTRMLMAQTWQLELQQPKRAIPHWLQAIADGAGVNAYGRIANAYEETGQPEEASRWHGRIVTDFPGSSIARQILGAPK